MRIEEDKGSKECILPVLISILYAVAHFIPAFRRKIQVDEVNRGNERSSFAIAGVRFRQHRKLSQRAGVTLTALVMLGMLLASPLVAILGVESAAAQPIGVTFDRQLSGDRVGQHKAPPFTLVAMTITATVSSPIGNGVLIDYFPNEWTLVDAKGGAVSVHDENYNKVEWNVGAVSGSVSRSYVVRSPQLTSPPTKYYFHSELTYEGGSAVSDDWMVIVADPSEVTIETSMYDVTDEYSPGPHAVFISDQVGYVFYQKTQGGRAEAVYSKTTDGGATWGASVAIDPATRYTFRSFSVWYDRWIPGDDTGTKIHIFAPSYDTDEAHYNYLDTADDSTRGSWSSTPAWSFNNAPDGGCVIVKSTEGYLFAVGFGNATGDAVDFFKSTDNGDTWSFITPDPRYAEYNDDDDYAQIVPLSGGDILVVYHDTTDNTLYWDIYDEDTDSWSGSLTTLDTKTETAGYDALFGGSIYRSTGDFYMAANNHPNSADGDLKAYKFSDSSRSWTTLTNILTDTLAYDVKIAVDQNNGDLYAIYSMDTGIYWKKSTDGGSSWSDATQLGTRSGCDIVSHNFMSTERIYGFWYEDPSNDLFGDTIADITPPLPGKPVLYLPENNTTTYDNTPYFEWTAGSNATSHRLVIDNDPNFADGENIYDNANLGGTENSITIENELPPDNYYWKVAAINAQGENWSENTWTFEVVVGEWQLIETWIGTIEAPAEWQLIEEWMGTVSTPGVWNLVETWTGTISAPVQWQLIETWTGTIETPVVGEWQLIETWTGIIEVPAEWQLIETWARTIQAPAEWRLVETWTGVVEAPTEWKLVETWSGAIEAPTGWQLIEEWMGTISAPVVWDLIESWTSAVEAPVAWQLIETWTGTIEAPAAWQLVETWTGTVQAPIEWQIVEIWTGTVKAPVEWQLIETWTGTVETLAEWQLIETWTGTIQAPVAWQIIETWIGTVQAPVEWQIVETWTGTVEAPVEWQIVEIWTGTVKAPVEWQLIETWTGTVETLAEWKLIETWTGTIQAPVAWQIIETWIGTVQAPVEWQIVETWTGTFGAPAGWNLIETWTGVIEASAEWQLIETWTGVVKAPAAWQLIETWSGAIESPVGWQLIEEWLGTVSAQAVWYLIESWTGAVEAPVAWQLIETWIGTVEAPAAWQLIETWTGTIEAPVVWQLIETWTGTVEAPAAWQLIETWTGIIEAPVYPSKPILYLPADGSITNDNTPYFEWTLGTNADNHRLLVDNDPDFTLPEENVLLGATDNTYTPTAELADENYSWKVIAINAFGENESTVWTFKIDTAAPAAPSLLGPANGSLTNDNTPTFRWTSVTDPSGVTYTIQVDNDSDFTSPEVNVSGLTENTYTPSALADENYSWRVRAVDGANNVGDWSSIWTLLVDTTPPPQITLISPPDGTKTNDNTPTFTWNSVSDPSGVTYTIQVDNDADFTSPEVNVSGLIDNSYTPSALADENYSWRVRAVDGAGNPGNWSTVWTLFIDTTAPAAPSLLEPADGSLTNDNTPTFRWTEVTDVSGVTYTIQVDNDADFTSPEVNVSGFTENSYTPSALADENYSWHVRAVDGANNAGDWSTTWTFVIDTVPPGTPALQSPTDGVITNDNTPTFDWSDVAGAENYDLLVDNDADFSSPEIQVTVPASIHTPTAGLPDENYSWKVRARDAANNVSDYSSAWTLLIDTVPPDIPTLQSPADGTITNDNTPTFDWSDVADAVEYRLQVDNDPDFSSPEINVLVASSTYTPTAELADENYSWRVQARDSVNNWSPWSSVWTLVVAVRVRAVDVSVSPSWQENIPGGFLSYVVVATNFGEVADDLNLSVSDALGWGLSLDNTRFENVENGGSRSTTLRVTIPSTAVPSQTDNITVTVMSEGDPSKSDSENCQAHVALLRDVEVEISPSWREGSPGATLLYVVTVKNTGHLNDKYNLIASDNLGWALEISPTELWIENGDNDIASLSVTIPLETVSSITDNITVRAEGTLAQGTSSDPENVSAENTAEARCTVIRDVDVSISPSYQSDMPGTLLTYTVTITNTGNALDTYELTTSDNAGWSPVVSPSSIGLSPSASGNATLKVIVPLDAIGSTRDNIIVTATSQLENTVSGTASCIAQAFTITLHDPIHIVGNDNFTEANGVISGSGTLGDPYIIGYWDINAENVHGIWIESTDVYFIIRSVRTHDGGYGYNYGIYFDHVENGKIESATSYFNDIGIYLKNSSNNIISQSNASYNVNGIYLQSSSNNIIEKCTASNNFSHGIHLESSDNNIISNCTAKNNTNGVYLQSSSNNKIIDDSNTSNNGLGGIVIRFSSENNLVKESVAENNYYGVYISDLSDNNRIYHNSFRNYPYQAWDNCSNRWDNSYPSGGNYWSDYTGVDNYRGENQDIPGSDGIGDTPYVIPGGTSKDRYPLVIRSIKLSISLYYQEGMPGAKLSYTVTLTNMGTIVDNYSLTVSDNADWGPTITPSSLSVYPDNSENAILEVTIPENAENSNRDNIRVVARSQTDNTASSESSCIAHAVIRGVIVSISPSYQGASPGVELAYTVTVTNIGLADDTYNLSATDNSGWGPSVTPSSLLVLVGENETATLNVTVPENAMPSTEDNITVVAISQENPNVGDNDSCMARASIGRGVEVLISPRENGELARENVTFTVKITNTGNAVDNYDLAVTDNLGWGPTLSENSLENVQPGENRSATLSVGIPENAEPYTEDNITVIAIPRGDPGVSDNDSCIAHVLSPKAEFSLVTLYKVSLDLDLWLDNGSKLVVKFYTWAGAYQAENIVWSGPTPAHVVLLKDIPHPENKPVENATLMLTDNADNVISTITSFVVRRSDLIARISAIKGRWPFAPPPERSALIGEISAIKGQWPFAPA